MSFRDVIVLFDLMEIFSHLFLNFFYILYQVGHFMFFFAKYETHI